MLTLDLALITHAPKGIEKIADMALPVVEGVRYIVSWQNHEGAAIPAELMRDDIEIHRFDHAGLSRNRNNAIDHCKADIVLIADDDIIYTAVGLKSVIQAFEDNPDVQLATFKADMPDGPVYPAVSCRLDAHLPKGYWISSINISFRRKEIGNLRFHPEFGIGSPRLHGAEDELFLLTAMRRGLNCRFFPVTICTHPHPSTGTKAHFSPGNLRAVGCYITIAYPRSFVPRLALKAWRLSRKGQSGFFRAIRYLSSGAAEAPRILRSSARYL